jgi:dTDP-4-amino-4,6-dideoxygalactose transaminase
MTQFNIKFIGLNRLFNNYRNEYMEATEKVLNSGIVVGGPHVNEFEKNLAKITNRKYAVSVTSCTDALFFILTACGIGRGDEVITTSYSFIATASAILRTGAAPVFVDVDEHYHLNLEQVHKKKTDKTKAVIAINLLGDCVDFPAFEEYCSNENLLLIEDAAQSFGARYGNLPSGKLGHASALSFSPMKPLPCFGTAGAVVTDDENLADKCKCLRRHGKSNESPSSIMLGYNSVIPADKAAQLNISLKYVDQWQKRRSIIADRYIADIEEIRDIITPKTRNNAVHCWHKFMIRSSRRDKLKEHLINKGIETQIHYKFPLPSEPIFGDKNPDSYSQAISYSRTCLSLPIYAELEDEEISYIIKQIRDFYIN